MNKFLKYNLEYISGRMSLRSPQKESLKILDNILNNIELSKNINLDETLKKVNSLYPTCSDFERKFLSLAFVLATGVGKTKLMGTFITYLYTNYNIKNFFVVAPNKTIYNKLKQDLINSQKIWIKNLSESKNYTGDVVFHGLCSREKAQTIREINLIQQRILELTNKYKKYLD